MLALSPAFPPRFLRPKAWSSLLVQAPCKGTMHGGCWGVTLMVRGPGPLLREGGALKAPKPYLLIRQLTPRVAFIRVRGLAPEKKYLCRPLRNREKWGVGGKAPGTVLLRFACSTLLRWSQEAPLPPSWFIEEEGCWMLREGMWLPPSHTADTSRAAFQLPRTLPLLTSCLGPRKAKWVGLGCLVSTLSVLFPPHGSRSGHVGGESHGC